MQPSANTGSQVTATEVKFHTYPFNCTSPLVNVLPRRSIPASLHLLTISAFYITGSACIAVRLCCRVTVNLHQNRNFQTLRQPGASL
ncbi:hypothetical protein YX04_000894 [Salmonella enterica subsp. enterica]|nr:hypothetical protein [Salmonella enterica]ECC9829066.1 hypothetical protein [Salmonella enterica subsp. enterica]EDT6462950.1 hypothetical protein [Salmonella enterica subsp. enterica]EDU0614751.1 hypothetical protein [Salmonella enterica subsp. salamae]